MFQFYQAVQSVIFSKESSGRGEPLVRRQWHEHRPVPSDDDDRSFEVQHSAELVHHKMHHKKQHGRHAEKEGHQQEQSHGDQAGYVTGSDVDTDSEVNKDAPEW